MVDQFGRSLEEDRLALGIGERPVRLADLPGEAREIHWLAAQADVEGVGHRVRHQTVDHRRQSLGARAYVPHLRAHLLRIAVQVDEVRQHLGPAEDHRQRILKIVCDGPEDLGLQAIGPTQIRSLQIQPPVGTDQFGRTLDDTLLQIGIRSLKSLVEDDVVEGDRQAAREQGDERPIRFRELAIRFDQRDDLTTARRIQIKGRPMLAEAVAALGEGTLHQGLHPLLQGPSGFAPA